MDDPDPFTNWVQTVRKVPVAGTASNFIIPFVNTISNLTKRGVEMTPGLGLVKEAVSRGMGRGQPPPEVIAKQIEGAVLTMYLLHKFDIEDITGPLPESKSEREAFYRAGKKPWAVKINGTYYQFRRIEPFNTVIAAVAIARDQIRRAKDDETATEIFQKTARGVVENLIDSSYFQGVQQLLDKHGSTKGALPRFAASWVPASSFWRSINRAYEAETQGKAKVHEGNEWLKAFSQVIPGLSAKLPARIDLWGEPVTLPGGVFRQWLPYKWSEKTTDPVELELERIGVYPGLPRNKITLRKNEEYTLTEAEYRQYCIDFGHNLKGKLSDLITRQSYQDSPDDRKLDKMQNRLQIARRQALSRIKRAIRDKELK